MFKSFTLIFSFKSAPLSVLLTLWLLPLLGSAQTTLVNYDFNSATAYPVAPAAAAAGITSAATSSEAYASATGIATGPDAFTANVAGPALGMSNFSGTNTKYFQFSLNGASLPKYSAFKVYVQGYRSSAGATTLTLQYSLNGTAYQPFGSAYTIGAPSSFTEGSFDLSGLPALNAPNSLTFRLLASGSTSTSGTLRIDNFQVQATNTVDPLISSLTPNAVEAGSADFTLAVGGSNFSGGAVVSFHNQALPTTYISATLLTATVPAAAVAVAGSYAVAVASSAGGSVASPPAAFTVTPALPHWKGPAGVGSWFDAANWSTGAVPGSADDVLLDHRFVAGSYTVSFDQNTAVTLKSLTVNPGAGDSIFVLVPASNTVAPAALRLSNTGAGAGALAICSKGVVTNASGADSGAGIEVAGTGATAFIYNGGSYRQASSTSHRLVVENLSAAAGTELGIFDFRLPATGPGSYTLSLSGRTYGTLILRNRPGQATSGYGGAGNSLTIQGNLLIGPGVTFSPALGASLSLMGDVRSQGTLQFKSASPPTTTSQLVLAGTKPQTITGTVLLDAGVGLALNNPAGVTLATPLLLGGPLALNSGTLTTTAVNLLTLSSAASLAGSGGNSTSFVNGPLARQTVAGALSNFTFPVGSGTAFRPVVLNATAQDVTTYLVTPKEGPAADPANLLAGTGALPALTRVSRVRSYTIAPTPAANHFSGTVTLSFGPDDNVNQPAAASFTIGKNSNGAGWQNIGNGGVTIAIPATATTGATGTITSQTFTSFSDFALASTSPEATVNPLPVRLTSFGAVRQTSGAVQITWATASEQRSAYFEVQRSLDGTTFSAIAKVAGYGTTGQAQVYVTQDGAAPATQLYYRLRQVDIDGRAAYSPVVTLAASAAADALVLYPNPAHDQLVVPAPAGTSVQVLDLTGRVLLTISLPPSGEVRVAELPAGTYLMRMGEGRVLRFSKQ